MGGGIEWYTELSGTDRRNWSFLTEDVISGDFNLLRSSSAGAAPSIVTLAFQRTGSAEFKSDLQTLGKLGASDNNGLFLRGNSDVTHKLYYTSTGTVGIILEINNNFRINYYNGGSPSTPFTFSTGGNLTATGITTSNRFISSATDNGSGEYYFFTGNAAVSNNLTIYAYANSVYTNAYSSYHIRANNTGGSGGYIFLHGGSVMLGTADAPVLHSGTRGVVIKGSARGILELWDATSGKSVFQNVGGDTYIGQLDKGTGAGSTFLLVNGNGSTADVALTLTSTAAATFASTLRTNGNVGVRVTPSSASDQYLTTGDAGIAYSNTYFGTGMVRIGGGSDHVDNTVLSVAPGVVVFDRPGISGGALKITGTGQILMGTTAALQSNEKLAVTSSTNTPIIAQFTGGSTSGWAAKFWNNGTTGDNLIAEFLTESSLTARGSIRYDRSGDRLNIAGAGSGLYFTGTAAAFYTTTANDNEGTLKYENGNTGTGGATNAQLLGKSKFGTAQFMVWENYGIRFGMRSTANSGAGSIYFTTGTDAVKMLIDNAGSVKFGSNNSTIIGADGGSGYIYSYSSGDPKIYIEANGTVAFLNPTGVFIGTTTRWNNERFGIQITNTNNWTNIPSMIRLTNFTSGGITKITFTDSSIIDGWLGMVPSAAAKSYFAMGFAGYTEQGFKVYQNGYAYVQNRLGVNVDYDSLGWKLQVADVGANISGGEAISTSTMKGVMIENTNNGNESIGVWFRTGSNHLSGISAQRNDSASTWGTDLRFYTHQNATSSLTSAFQRMIITSEGAMGLGVTPTNTGGRFEASNDIVAYSSSDIRFKKNVTEIKEPLQKISKIRGISFDWIEMEEFHGNSGHDVGVIAQEIEEVLPEIVTTRESGYKAVKYEKIVPLLIEAIKEQQATIASLEARINMLESK
jgi:hypothetical protein